jgi:hypothetical protein
MDLIGDFLSWAWLRHHNVLSWYIRPLFILPFVYFAYKRSWPGMLVTVLALASSMFWFPAPRLPDPQVAQFLEAERAFLLGPLTAQKALAWLLVPLFFALLGLAFWKRSWWWGLAVINLAALGKVAWSVLAGGSAGWAVLLPALAGMLVCDLAVVLGLKYRQARGPAKANA